MVPRDQIKDVKIDNNELGRNASQSQKISAASPKSGELLTTTQIEHEATAMQRQRSRTLSNIPLNPPSLSSTPPVTRGLTPLHGQHLSLSPSDDVPNLQSRSNSNSSRTSEQVPRKSSKSLILPQDVQISTEQTHFKEALEEIQKEVDSLIAMYEAVGARSRAFYDDRKRFRTEHLSRLKKCKVSPTED